LNGAFNLPIDLSWFFSAKSFHLVVVEIHEHDELKQCMSDVMNHDILFDNIGLGYSTGRSVVVGSTI
jgi:hypothetical protein